MNIVNFSEARNNLKNVLDHVSNDIDYTVITRRDANDAVVMSLDSLMVSLKQYTYFKALQMPLT